MCQGFPYKAVGSCCSVISGFGVLMLCVVGYALGTGSELLGEFPEIKGEGGVITTPHQLQVLASGRCYTAAGVYAVFFIISVAAICFGPSDGAGGKRLVF